MDLDSQTRQALTPDLADGPLTPPAPDGPNNTYKVSDEDASIWQNISKETQHFLRSKHPYFAFPQAAMEFVGPTADAADLRDSYTSFKEATESAVKGDVPNTVVGGAYGAASLAAAFIPGIGGLGDVRRAVKDTSLFRQNPDKGVTRVEATLNPDFEKIDRVIREAEQGLREFTEELSRQSGYSPDTINNDLLAYRMDQEAFLPTMIRRYGEIDPTGFGDKEPAIQYLDTIRRQLADLLEERVNTPYEIGPSASNLQSFYNPIESAIENLPYNKNGTIRGDKARQFMQDKGYVNGSTFQFTFPDYSGFDSKREYTQAELQDLYDRHSFRVVGYTEAPAYQNYQRQSSGSWGEIEDYQELLIDVVPTEKSVNTRTTLSKSSHFTDQNLAHARVSIRTADGVGIQQLFPPEERYVLVEEIQSDYVQGKGQGFGGRNFDSPFYPEQQEGIPNRPEPSPVKGIGDTTRLSLMQTIMYAKENGVNFVVVPSPEDIAYAGRVVEGEEIPKGFYNTYRDAVKKALIRIQQDTKGQVSFGTETYTPQEEFITGEGFLEDVPLSDAPNEPRTVTIIDISNLEIDPERTELRFNKGGMVPNMEPDQTMAAFGQQQQPETDPVSGNPVPPGGTPEGVRDNIDAKLSEGEFVIPAHVVRFIGVGQLLQLISATEQQISKMEQNGMTGEPVSQTADAQGELPFDPSTLETEDSVEGAAGSPTGFNEGGLVQDSRLGKAATTPAASQLPSVAMYRDRTGFIRAIPIINGKPVGIVPPGSESINATTNTGASQQQTQQASNQTILNEESGHTSSVEPKSSTGYNVNELTGTEARSMLGGQKNISDFTGSVAGKTVRSIAGLVPGIGSVLSMGMGAQGAITNALANQVLEKEYGAPRASLADNVFGRTSFGGSSQLGKPADLLNQLDRGRESGGSNISTAEHTRTPDGGYNFGNQNNIQQGWGYVTEVSGPNGEGSPNTNQNGPGGFPDADQGWGSGSFLY